MELKHVLAQPSAVVIDVRTPMEFMGGHVAGSINIPLNEIPSRIDELTKMSRPMVLCCASGGRSAQAQAYLRGMGINQVYDGGPWVNVNYLKYNA